MILIAANYVISIRRCIKVGVTGNALYFVTCPYPKWDSKETWLYISLELFEMEEIELNRNK
jgi:hypothetical protein